ncbi:hypothetical protein [Longimicrobium sp.]|uniref:glycine-rich domain-containing protein n=1 Tax=Longimicrobium sp. TaxID=2029185 RepID=UPI002BE974C3|nr:hypothetical protein [Longimicrobium sp.]HSU14116.1 hypothetical protein [Longimicrobium sp.]
METVAHPAGVARTDEQLAHVRKAVAELDLRLVKKKVASETDWSEEKVNHLASVYRRFLFLCYKHPGVTVATRDVDAFWHRHILDTRKYAADCQEMFGFFLHHDPHALHRDPDLTRSVLDDRFRETHRLYEMEFGEKSFDVYKAQCDDCVPDYDDMGSESRP